jgi:hypothetical protein
VRPRSQVRRVAPNTPGWRPRAALSIKRDAGHAPWDAAGAKAFDYPCFWVKRAGDPLEELGYKPDGVWKISSRNTHPSCRLSESFAAWIRSAFSCRLQRATIQRDNSYRLPLQLK